MAAVVSCRHRWELLFHYVSWRLFWCLGKAFALIACTACDGLCFVIVCGSFSSGPLEFSEFGIAAAWFRLACCSGVETGICQSLRLPGQG